MNDIINLLGINELDEDTTFLESPYETLHNLTDEASDNEEHTGDINNLPASVLKAKVILSKKKSNNNEIKARNEPKNRNA